MQETKVDDAVFPSGEFEKLGYYLSFKGGKQYNGVAIASKQKPAKVNFGLPGKHADNDRLAAAFFDDLVILNAYVPQGQGVEKPQFAYKLEWLKRLKNYLKKNFDPLQKLVLCGDFNIAPEDIDVHDPKRILGHVSFNPQVWKSYKELLSWGLVDLFRLHHPGELEQYTFFDYRVSDSVGRKLGWRVDHILATVVLAKSSKSCVIDMKPRFEDKPSDHTVIYAQW